MRRIPPICILHFIRSRQSAILSSSRLFHSESELERRQAAVKMWHLATHARALAEKAIYHKMRDSDASSRRAQPPDVALRRKFGFNADLIHMTLMGLLQLHQCALAPSN